MPKLLVFSLALHCRRYCITLALNLFYLLLAGAAAAQTTLNEGHEFWVAFPSHDHDFNSSGEIDYPNMSIFIAAKDASTGTVSVGNYRKSFTITPNGSVEILVPFKQSYININESGRILRNRAIHIQTDAGKPPVVVYAHIFAAQRSAATLVLPKDGLGARYYSMNYPPALQEGKNFITVVATQPDTRIFFRRGNQELVPGGVLLEHVNDVYQYASLTDLTGVRVETAMPESGCDRFAAFTGCTGSIITSIKCGSLTLDPLFQQAYPLRSWGKTYAFVPFSMKSTYFDHLVRQSGQQVRVLAQEDNTTIWINGIIRGTYNAGQYYFSNLLFDKPAFIEADKSICVAQYALSESCASIDQSTDEVSDGFSDPDMVLLNPLEFGVKDITIFSSRREKIKEQYVNIVISKAAAASFRINGKPPTGKFMEMPGPSNYVYLQQDLTQYKEQVFRLQASSVFNATAYGFGRTESYAYAAGTALASGYEISIVDDASGERIDSACTDDRFHFSLKAAAALSRITWKPAGSPVSIIQENPLPKVSTENGRKVFIYELAKTSGYRQPGKQPIQVIAQQKGGRCSAETLDTLSATIFVIAPPSAAIRAQPTGCPGEMMFYNTGDTSAVMSWKFGDNNLPDDQNSSALNHPSHTYRDTGRYIVHLSVKNRFGCNNEITDTIYITTTNKNVITMSGSACAGLPMQFTPQLAQAAFVPVSFTWRFGDGDSLQTTKQVPVSHTYQQGGNYTVQLLVQNAAGCTTTTTSTAQISTLPQPKFTFKRICGSNRVVFKNETVEASPSAAIKYLWNFGDGAVSEALSPEHNYASGEFNVKLTAINSKGCERYADQKIKLSPSTVKADFSLSHTIICVGEELVLKDLTTTTGTTISRIEWEYGSPANVEQVQQPTNSNEYRHRFLPLPTGINESIVQITLRVYTMDGCMDVISKPITLAAKPSLLFNALHNICISKGSIMLTQGRETTGIAGHASYSGPGTSEDGHFDPATAGIGEHHIWYRYYTAAGCADSISQRIIVYPAPSTTLPPVIYLVKGRSAVLDPGEVFAAAQYQWSPSAGLSDALTAKPVASPDQTTRYTVNVEQGGCTAIASVQVIVLPEIEIVNTFTPNGDGANDVWNIRGLEQYAAATVSIFNRYGMQVFSSLGYVCPWDGTHKGRPVPAGTYYYIVRPGMGLRELSGYIMLLR